MHPALGHHLASFGFYNDPVRMIDNDRQSKLVAYTVNPYVLTILEKYNKG